MDIVAILNIGVIGLGFLLAYLSFSLLSRAQQNGTALVPTTPTYVFMAFSIGVIIIGLFSEYLRYDYDLRLGQLEKANETLTAENTSLKNNVAASSAPYIARLNQLKQKLSSVSADVGAMSGDIEVCRHQSWGASTNTSDAHGCTVAAISAMNAGQKALTSAQAIKGSVDALATQ